MNNEKKTKRSIIKSETKMIMYVVICMVIVAISASYALFFQVDQNNKNQVVKSGDLTFTYSAGTQITATSENCFEPISVDDAKADTSSCYYELSVTNGGTLAGAYTINLLPDDGNAIEASKLKVIVRKKTGDSYAIESGFPKAVNTLANNAVITETINPKETKVYSIKLFVDSAEAKEADDEKAIAYSIKGVAEVNEGGNLSPKH